jgi:DNA-binding CsgD family transcriptional regulator
MAAADVILGRDKELAAIEGFLETPASASALLLRGEPGIGKTTVWQASLTLASERGYTVLSSRPTEPEAKFSFLGLGDLLENLGSEVLAELPYPQRLALEVALLRTEAPSKGLDHRTVCVAVLAALRTISSSAPIIIAIDDVQWLDGSTALVLEFVVRRLTDEPIRFIASLRFPVGANDEVGFVRRLGESQARTIDLKGLSPDALTELFRERLHTSFSRPTVNRLFEISGGNAFFALEIARASIAGRLQLEPGRLVSLPNDLADLVPIRVGELPPSTQELLLMCSAASTPTTSLLRFAAADPDRLSSDLDTAASAGLIDIEGGRIRFTHPLLSSAIYSEASPVQRRQIHHRLAETVRDEEERAWHLALAASGADPKIAAALEDAAHLSCRRGAPSAASDLCLLAADLTPPEDRSTAHRLQMRAAEYLTLAGDPKRALAVIGPIVETAPTGPERAEALLQEGMALLYVMDFERAAQDLGLALLEPDVPPERLVTMHSDRAWAVLWHDLRMAERHAEEAVYLGERCDDPTRLATALSTLITVRTLLGSTVPAALMDRALALDEVANPSMVFDRPGMILAIRRLLEGRLDEARRLFLQLLDEATAKGDEASAGEISAYLGWLEHLAGNWDAVVEREARSSGLPDAAAWSLLRLARVEACRGDTDRAAAEAQAALESPVLAFDLGSQIEALSVLGFIDLSNGDLVRSHEHLSAAWKIHSRWGFGEPDWFLFVADHLEVLVALGRYEDAKRVLMWLAERGCALNRPWALAVVARYRGMLAAAGGDFPSALASADEALQRHGRLQMPFEHGRTLLVQGTIRRRAKQKRLAREALEQALEIFERLGAPLWAAKARAELARVSGRRPVAGGLTPAERQVARLAAAGQTNREIAEALFTSTRTVGGHLSHIYAKLGIRSRTELAHYSELAGGERNDS